MTWSKTSVERNRIFEFQSLDPNPSDLTIIRFIDRTCRCGNILGWMVVGCEMLIELGDSWFYRENYGSSQTISSLFCMAPGCQAWTQNEWRFGLWWWMVYQGVKAKLHGQERNNSIYRPRFPNYSSVDSRRLANKELHNVSLEAAIRKRVSNITRKEDIPSRRVISPSMLGSYAIYLSHGNNRAPSVPHDWVAICRRDCNPSD